MHFVWESTVFAVLAFGLLYFLLNKYAFGPLFGVMEKRKELIQEQMKTAEQNRQQSEQLIAEQRAAIEQARSEAKTIIEQAKTTSLKQAEDIVQQAQEESIRLKDEALRDIENEKNKAVASIKTQVSAMSVLIASKIIEKQIDEKSQQELVENYLKEAGGSQ